MTSDGLMSSVGHDQGHYNMIRDTTMIKPKNIVSFPPRMLIMLFLLLSVCLSVYLFVDKITQKVVDKF